MDRIDWVEDALCAQVDPEIFFPEQAQLAHAKPAKSICANCPVTSQCLDYGMDMQFGVYGGLTATERAQLRRKTKGVAA